MKSWKTTLCGIVAAACAGVAGMSGGDPTIIKIATVLGSLAVAAMGWFAKDSNVTGAN